MRFSKSALLLVLAAVVAAGPALAKKKPVPPGPHEAYGGRAEIIIQDQVYVPDSKNPKHRLDIYSNPHEGLWPVVVMIHGGAWIKGTKSYDNKVWICKVLANHGYVVFSIDYRLAPWTKLKGQAEDAMAAVIWVKQHAEQFGGDPTRVGVTGGSAGGHLGLLVAWASDDPYFRPTKVRETELDSEVRVAGVYYPVIDLDETLRQNTRGFTPLARLLLVGAVGKRYRAALQHLSPHLELDPSDPPTLFLTGDADELKLYPQSVAYAEKLKELGIDGRLFTAPGKKHGFTWEYWSPESLNSVQALVDFFDLYLKPAERH